MRVMSVYDLQLIPALSGLSMFDFVNPANHELLIPYLKTLGYDLLRPVEFIASQHRTMAGKVVIGYQVVGEISQDREFLLSPFCTAEDRIIAAGSKDLSLANEMARSMTTCREYGSDGAVVEGFPADQANPDEAEILEAIRVYQVVMEIARGDQFKSDGSRKTLLEWNEVVK